MIGKRTVVAIVPARGGSKELPDKPMTSFSLNVLKP
jgi:CMP-N-acetylneuraminic acid synthetase